MKLFAPNQVARLTNNLIDNLPCPEHLIVISQEQLDFVEEAMEDCEDIADLVRKENLNPSTLVIFEDDSVVSVARLRRILSQI